MIPGAGHNPYSSAQNVSHSTQPAADPNPRARQLYDRYQSLGYNNAQALEFVKKGSFHFHEKYPHWQGPSSAVIQPHLSLSQAGPLHSSLPQSQRGAVAHQRIMQQAYGVPQTHSYGQPSSAQGAAPITSYSSTNTALIRTRKAESADNDAVHEFIMDLDDDTYEKRFSDLPAEAMKNFVNRRTGEHEAVFISHDGEQVVGMADVADSARYDANLVSIVNVAVKREFQGKGIGKQLDDIQTEYLKQNGYKYKVAFVYYDNDKHIDRLIRKGWTETAASISATENEDDDIRVFWMALDPQYKNQEPTPLR